MPHGRNVRVPIDHFLGTGVPNFNRFGTGGGDSDKDFGDSGEGEDGFGLARDAVILGLERPGGFASIGKMKGAAEIVSSFVEEGKGLAAARPNCLESGADADGVAAVLVTSITATPYCFGVCLLDTFCKTSASFFLLLCA